MSCLLKLLYSFLSVNFKRWPEMSLSFISFASGAHFTYSICCCRYVGISRPGSDATEVSACTDGPWLGERCPEAQVEVAADSAEQRGLFQRCLCAPCSMCTDLWCSMGWWGVLAELVAPLCLSQQGSVISWICKMCTNAKFGRIYTSILLSVSSRECLSLLSLVWCTRKRNGRKSGMNCWSSPPASQGYITAPTAPSGMVNLH